MTKLEAHEIALRYPWSEEACVGIVEYLREHGGVPIPIVLLDGKILDGRHRYEACKRIGRQPRTREFGSDESDGDSPELFAWKMNAIRRHLTETQLAGLAAKIAAEQKRPEAKARQVASGGDHRKKAVPRDLEEPLDAARSRLDGEALAVAAKEVGTTRGAAYRARAIQRAAPEVFKRMIDGEYPTIVAAERDAGVPTPGANAREKPEPPKSKPRREAPDAKGAPLHERSYLDPELRARVLELLSDGVSVTEAAAVIEHGDGAYVSGAVGGFKKPSAATVSRVSRIRSESADKANPLESLVDAIEAAESDFKSWCASFEPKWRTATPAQADRLRARVDAMVSSARRFVSQLNKEIQS